VKTEDGEVLGPVAEVIEAGAAICFSFGAAIASICPDRRRVHPLIEPESGAIVVNLPEGCWSFRRASRSRSSAFPASSALDEDDPWRARRALVARRGPRDHADDAHRTVDDAPYGGGAGWC
jgi:hypothetical protein